MMKKLVYSTVLMLWLVLPASAQKKTATKYAYTQKIDNNYSLVFLKYDKQFKLYSSPAILCKTKLKKIVNFEGENFSGTQLKIANNKKYLVMDRIIKGYVYTEKDSVLHENYTCVIINVKKATVAMEMQTDCGGKWNNTNEWINNNKVVFKEERL